LRVKQNTTQEKNTQYTKKKKKSLSTTKRSIKDLNEKNSKAEEIECRKTRVTGKVRKMRNYGGASRTMVRITEWIKSARS